MQPWRPREKAFVEWQEAWLSERQARRAKEAINRKAARSQKSRHTELVVDITGAAANDLATETSKASDDIQSARKALENRRRNVLRQKNEQEKAMLKALEPSTNVAGYVKDRMRDV